MSKISYCSLEEAWGSSYNKTNDNNVKDNSNSSTNNSSSITNSSISNNNLKENNNKIQIRNDEKYNLLYKKSEEDYENVVNNMNTVERRNNNSSEKSIVEYNKYRINSSNQVSQNHIEDDHSMQKYMPFSESIERKYLEDKLKFLESEILKYKHLFEKDDYDSSNSNKNNYIESFSNQNSSNSNTPSKTNDIIDIILLIIIGLIIILVMNSIFNIGKAIGVRNK